VVAGGVRLREEHEPKRAGRPREAGTGRDTRCRSTGMPGATVRHAKHATKHAGGKADRTLHHGQRSTGEKRVHTAEKCHVRRRTATTAMGPNG